MNLIDCSYFYVGPLQVMNARAIDDLDNNAADVQECINGYIEWYQDEFLLKMVGKGVASVVTDYLSKCEADDGYTVRIAIQQYSIRVSRLGRKLLFQRRPKTSRQTTLVKRKRNRRRKPPTALSSEASTLLSRNINHLIFLRYGLQEGRKIRLRLYP